MNAHTAIADFDSRAYIHYSLLNIIAIFSVGKEQDQKSVTNDNYQ